MYDLFEEQKDIVVTAIDTMIKFLTNNPGYVLFCATLLGGGGTGKSYIINTLIAIVGGIPIVASQLTLQHHLVRLHLIFRAALFTNCWIYLLVQISWQSPFWTRSKAYSKKTGVVIDVGGRQEKHFYLRYVYSS